jgi:hypothetical protein
VFSHALALTAEQNTPLMEHLASQGFVVVGIGHTRLSFRVISSQGLVIPVDLDKLREAFTEGAALDRVAMDARLARASSADERATIMLEFGERATKMNEQIAVRVADVQFVMDAISAPPQEDLELARLLARVDAGRIGVLGMSIGGVTATEVCKIDTRCRAGLNLDGALFGQHRRQALQTPFLSVVSAPNRKFDEHQFSKSESDYYQVLVEGAGHGDFLDLTFLMPFMKWLGANGTIAPGRAVEIVNVVSSRFFDTYLRDGVKPRFDRREFPELRVTMNDQASQ